MHRIGKTTIALSAAFVMCVSLAGCSLRDKIKEYSGSKTPCYPNTENVTQFSYKGHDYTILEETV